ncbi:MAG TPA: hypothetical protein VGM18_16045 [Candidatus Sulfotelmatobacter sp.]
MKLANNHRSGGIEPPTPDSKRDGRAMVVASNSAEGNGLEIVSLSADRVATGLHCSKQSRAPAAYWLRRTISGIEFNRYFDTYFDIHRLGELALRKDDISRVRNIKYPDWQREFEAALVDGDAETLRQRVDAAEAAIFLRSQASAGPTEKEAMAEAIRRLRAVQRKKLGYPDWKKS